MRGAVPLAAYVLYTSYIAVYRVSAACSPERRGEKLLPVVLLRFRALLDDCRVDSGYWLAWQLWRQGTTSLRNAVLGEEGSRCDGKSVPACIS